MAESEIAMLVIEKNSEVRTRAPRMKNTMKNRPIGLTQTMSPYPTVDMVTRVK